MPKNRLYTRKELETLRRADLQGLYKMNGLRGGNQKSDVMIDTLVDHFSSSSFIPPPSSPATMKAYARKPIRIQKDTYLAKELGRPLMKEIRPRDVTRVARPRTVGIEIPPPRAAAREDTVQEQRVEPGDLPQPSRFGLECGMIALPTIPLLTIKSSAPDLTSSTPTPAKAPVSLVASAEPEGTEGRSTFATIVDLNAARSEIRALQELVKAVAGMPQERARAMMEENNRLWETRLQEAEEKWNAAMKDLEQKWMACLRLPVEASSEPALGDVQAQAEEPSRLFGKPQFKGTSNTPSARRNTLGKRAHLSVSTSPAAQNETSDAGPSHVSDPIIISPVRKRARLEDIRTGPAPMEEEDSLSADDPRTPTAPRVSFAPFKIPILPRTPSPSHQGVAPDNFLTPRVGSDFFAHPPPFDASGKKRKRSGTLDELPYPIFATTPKPAEPTSPTTDAPPSTGRGGRKPPAMLTPGRHRAEPATRAVSDAHRELLTITESDEPRFERNRVFSDAPIPTFLGPELHRSTASSSPPRLSPSPTIGETTFSYTPFPSNPSRRARTGPPPRRMRNSSSPARDYMSVALHGLHHSTDSPATQHTPGHRTMLGTERYRDTRFGDIPVFQWGTPSVDLGSVTPGQLHLG